MKLLKSSWFAGLGLAAALLISPAAGLAYTNTYTNTYYGPAPSQAQTTTTVTTGRSMTVNPNSPQQFPPANFGFSADSRPGAFKAEYVDQQIALARARGINTAPAIGQEIQGRADLKKGLNEEAAQHFDAALRSLGVVPSQPEHNPGEVGVYHNPMP